MQFFSFLYTAVTLYGMRGNGFLQNPTDNRPRRHISEKHWFFKYVFHMFTKRVLRNFFFNERKCIALMNSWIHFLPLSTATSEINSIQTVVL